MEFGLVGKRILITGGSTGIGRETVLAFARAGATVVTCNRGPSDAAQRLAAELKTLGEHNRLVYADVTSPQDVTALAQTCRETLGELDVVVNNVGVDGRAKFTELTDGEWHRVLDANLTSCFLVTRAAMPLLVDHGSVIHIGASAGTRGRPESAHYCASKTALIGLTRSLAREYGSRGIRVNTVAPGVIVTEDGGGPPPPVADAIRAVTALGRLGVPADVTAAVLFLASDLSRFISGVTLNVDGGI